MTIYWIFGASAVGKKFFMLNADTYNPQFRGAVPTWINDGELEESEYVELIQRTSDSLVRWQWGRETTLGDIQEECPEISQRIILIISDLGVHIQRALEREKLNDTGNDLVWTEDKLKKEARTIRWMVLGIASYYMIPLTVVQTDDPDPRLWETRTVPLGIKHE